MGNKFAKYESKPFWLLVRGTLLHQWQAGAHKTMPFSPSIDMARAR